MAFESPLANPYRRSRHRRGAAFRSRGGRRTEFWSPAQLGLRAWYDAELGQPKHGGPGAYVQLDGTSGDYIYTPDTATVSFSNDIEVVMRVKVTDWSAAAIQTLVGKYVTTGNQRSWKIASNTSAQIIITVSTDGTTTNTATITPTVALPDNTWIWLRLRMDLTNGSNSVGTVETAADTGTNDEPSSWTANGTATATALAGIFDSTAPLEIGSFQNGTSERLAGQVARCIVRSGFAGTTVADFNASDCYGDGYWHSGGYRWTLGLPKIYDRSGNGVAPATFGAGSNQPLWLPWDGTPSVYLPGASGNYVSCPDAAALRITGDIEIVARVALSDWSPASVQSIASKYLTTGNQRSWRLVATTTGALQFLLSGDGVTTFASTPASSATLGSVGVVDGQTIWVKATRATSGTTQYFYTLDQAAEPTSWTQLGSTVGGTPGALFAATANLEVGSFQTGTSELAAGKVYRAIVRSGIGGTTVADFDASLCGQSGYTDAYSNVWTVNRATSGRKAVVQSPVAASARSVILHGTDDWIDVPAAAVPALDTFAAASAVTPVYRRWHNPGTLGHPIFTTKVTSPNAGLGFALRLTTSAGGTAIGVYVGDGAVTDGAEPGTGAPALGARAVHSANVGSTSPFVDVRCNGAANGSDVARATTGTTSTAGAGRIGAYVGGSVPIDMEFEALALRDTAMADTEHGQLTAYYKGGL